MAELGPSKMSKLLKTAQFYWFLSHVFTVLFFLVHLAYSFFNYKQSLRYYQFSLLSILTTYLIVIKQLKKKTMVQLINDENIQYFVLAATMYLSSLKIGVITGSLYSFVIFSIFHILNYYQNNLLEIFISSIQQQQLIHGKISHFVSTYNQQALLMAANAEMFLLFFGANPLIQLPTIFVNLMNKDLLAVLVRINLFLVVLVFNKLRYDSNQFTKLVIEQWDMKIQQLLVNYPQFSGVYNGTFKGLVAKYITPIKLPAPAPSQKKKN